MQVVWLMLVFFFFFVGLQEISEGGRRRLRSALALTDLFGGHVWLCVCVLVHMYVKANNFKLPLEPLLSKIDF